MKRIFKNKCNYSTLTKLISYYQFVRGKRMYNRSFRYGTFYTCDKVDEAQLKQYDNIVFLWSVSEYAPEQKKRVIFMFD